MLRGSWRIAPARVQGVEEWRDLQTLEGVSQMGRPRRVRALEATTATGMTQQIERPGTEPVRHREPPLLRARRALRLARLCLAGKFTIKA
jgi:hypothetical protein